MGNNELLKETINLQPYGGGSESNISVEQLLQFYIDSMVKKSLQEDYKIEEGREDTGRVFNGLVFNSIANKGYTTSGRNAINDGIAYEGVIQYNMIFENTTGKQDGYFVTINSKWEPNLPIADGRFVYDVKVNTIGEARLDNITAYNGAGIRVQMISKQVKPVTFKDMVDRISEPSTEGPVL